MHLKVSEDVTTQGILSAYQQSGAMLAAVQGIAERFPNIKAGEQYRALMDSIRQAEATVQSHRQTYNGAAREYNTTRATFPGVLVASRIGFAPAPYLDFEHGSHDFSSMRVMSPAKDEQRVDRLLDGSAPPRVEAALGAPRLAQAQPSAPAPTLAAGTEALGTQSNGHASAPPRRGRTVAMSSFPAVSIHFTSGPLAGRAFPLGQGVSIGREAPADVVVPDAQVSSDHAWIGIRDTNVVFIDRGSTNGSLVNEQRISPQTESLVKHDDVVTLGNVKFRVQVA
jgi:LemA family protein/type III secretion system (T3SS) inner membrane Yop/YscD-like protein